MSAVQREINVAPSRSRNCLDADEEDAATSNARPTDTVYVGDDVGSIDYLFASVCSGPSRVLLAAFSSNVKRVGEFVVQPAGVKVAHVYVIDGTCRVALVSFDQVAVGEGDLASVSERVIATFLPTRACYVLGSFCGGDENYESHVRAISSPYARAGNIDDAAFPALEAGVPLDGLEAALFSECSICGLPVHLIVAPRGVPNSGQCAVTLLSVIDDALREEFPDFLCDLQLAKTASLAGEKQGPSIGYT